MSLDAPFRSRGRTVGKQKDQGEGSKCNNIRAGGRGREERLVDDGLVVDRTTSMSAWTTLKSGECSYARL